MHISAERRTTGLRLLALALALAAVLASSVARAEWEYDAVAGMFFDDNLTRAQNAVDKRPATAVTATAAASRFVPFDGGHSVTLSAHVRGELFDRYPGLSNADAGAGASWRRKLGIGAYAPWLSLSADASYDGYRDDLRTGMRVEARASLGRRFDEALDASAAVYYERRYGDHGESIVPGISGNVFDLAGQGVDLRAGYALAGDWYLDARAGVRRGDVESTSQRSLPIFLASSAITDDPVWGDPNLYAYRLRGTTYTGSFGASYALSDRGSVDLTYRYALTRAAQGLSYSTNAIYLTLVYRP